MLTKPFKPLALAFLVNLIISVEDKIKYIKCPVGNSLSDISEHRFESATKYLKLRDHFGNGP